MTSRKTQKIIFLFCLCFLLLPVSSLTGGSKRHNAPIHLGVAMGPLPLYFFSVEPRGEVKTNSYYSGTSLSFFAALKNGRATVRGGAFWNFLTRTKGDGPRFLNMAAPFVQVTFRFLGSFYGGTGLAGLIIPGSQTTAGIKFPARLDLWFSALAGTTLASWEKYDIFGEIVYHLNITHRQWSEGRDPGGNTAVVYTRSAQILVINCGVRIRF